MNKKVVLAIGIVLLVLGYTKFDFSSLVPHAPVPSGVDVMELSEPTDPVVKKEAEDVIALLKTFGSSKGDFRRLRDLYLDMGRLVELDSEDLVIKNTEEIRQANSLAGVMLRLDMKNKFPNLAKECKEVIVASIGDDNVLLSKELRPKGVDGFNALAWAFNEGSK